MIRIVKLGGSLLDWPQFPAALRQWLSKQPPALNVFIAGGGALADAIRKADHDFALGDERSHWLCIEALSITARILAGVLPEFHLVSSFGDLQSKIAGKDGNGMIFDPSEFLTQHEHHLLGRALPHDWTVTSDSIAARIAECVMAEELVLLKSTDPPVGAIFDLAAGGYVDRYFPTAAAKLSPPRLVNLRGCNFGGSAF